MPAATWSSLSNADGSVRLQAAPSRFHLAEEENDRRH
jgi:hypothetical protein